MKIEGDISIFEAAWKTADDVGWIVVWRYIRLTSEDGTPNQTFVINNQVNYELESPSDIIFNSQTAEIYRFDYDINQGTSNPEYSLTEFMKKCDIARNLDGDFDIQINEEPIFIRFKR